MLPLMPERIGTPHSDNLQAHNNEIVYGGPGDDHITLGSWSYAYLIGGPGNDTYSIGNASFAVVLDSSGHDTVNLPFPLDVAGAFTLDGGRHLAIVDLYNGTAIGIIDQHRYPIEVFNFSDQTIQGSRVESAIKLNGLHVGDVSYDLVGSVSGINAGFWETGVEAEISSILAREGAIFASHPGDAHAHPAPAPLPVPSSPDAPVSAPIYFDAQWYLSQNTDVAAAGMDPFLHFTTFGWSEGRNPNPYFDSDWYLSQNPDVAAAGMNPVEHYWNFGWREGRDPSAEFSTNAYLELNTDVALAGMNPLEHYLEWGLVEGREISLLS